MCITLVLILGPYYNRAEHFFWTHVKLNLSKIRAEFSRRYFPSNFNMHSESCIWILLFAIIAVQMVSKTISSKVDFRIMTYRRVATFRPEIEVFYLMTSRSRSRIQCFSLCLNEQSKCIGIIYYQTQLLCRLLTADVTEDIVFAEELKSGLVALKKIHGN